MINRILSVDDNAMIQTIQTNIVRPFAHDVVKAMSGQAAIELLSRQAFDVVLMDIQMPTMNGLETAVAIRKLGIRVPIIAVTGNDTEEDRAQCLAAGMNGFVKKPIDAEVLRLELQKVLHVQW